MKTNFKNTLHKYILTKSVSSFRRGKNPSSLYNEQNLLKTIVTATHLLIADAIRNYSNGSQYLCIIILVIKFNYIHKS